MAAQSPNASAAQFLTFDRYARPAQKKWPKMVGWYDPGQLLQTGKQVVVSTIIGRHADRRLTEELGTIGYFQDFTALTTEAAGPPPAPDEYDEYGVNPMPVAVPAAGQELWIDYVSDVGDGWNSTYAVAHALAQDELKVKGVAAPLPRGQILLFGGDEIYPTADRDQYRRRLEAPYAAALHHPPATMPYAFALPGNHDWYDSLASFSEVFSSKSVPIKSSKLSYDEGAARRLWQVSTELTHLDATR